MNGAGGKNSNEDNHVMATALKTPSRLLDDYDGAVVFRPKGKLPSACTNRYQTSTRTQKLNRIGKETSMSCHRRAANQENKTWRLPRSFICGQCASIAIWQGLRGGGE
jgi:hypothetical protein